MDKAKFCKKIRRPRIGRKSFNMEKLKAFAALLFFLGIVWYVVWATWQD